MRVLQFLWRLSPEGGIPRVARDLAAGIDHTGFDLHICTARPLLAEDELGDIPDAVHLHSLDVAGTPGAATRARMALQLVQLTRRLRPDVLHLHSGTSWYATAAAPLVPRAGRVLEVHDTPQSGRYSAANASSMQTLVDRLGFHVVTHSTSVGQDLGAAWGLAAEQQTCIPLAIPAVASAGAGVRAAARARLGLHGDEQLVLYVARLVDSKRPELFLEVADAVISTNPRARFALVGGGPRLGALRAHIAAAGLDHVVDLPGRVDDLADHYRAASLFCSTSAYEGFGLALGEALVAGVPVVTTDVGGVRDVVTHGRSGLVVDSDRPDELATAVRTLLDDDITRKRFGAFGREDALDRFSITQMVDAYEQLYRSSAIRELAVAR